jgi:hypothetical protein
MTNPFADIERFGSACDQEPSEANYKMYLAWKEVMDTNFAKINPETGKVIKREDGKVLKPEGWKAPELAKFVNA